MWINALKIALIEEDTQKIDLLLSDLPILTDPADLQTAIYLLKESSQLLHRLKNDTSISMIQVKKNLDYLKSTTEKKQSKFDVRS